MRRVFRLIFCAYLVWGAPLVHSQTESTANVSGKGPRDLLYVIYDSSNSMWGELSDKSRKYEAGRTAMRSVLALPLTNKQLAFRAYGHRDKNDCKDSELIVPPATVEVAKPAIEKAVNSIRPTGKTPITYSLREALKDLGERQGDILLVSDGVETCGIDPCELMDEWRNSGVSIRVHVVGVGLNEFERSAMACVAETGGGQYFDAGSEQELIAAMNSATKITPGTPKPIAKTQGYALNVKGVDNTGRNFRLIGTLQKDGVDIMDLSSNGHNRLEGPGQYTMTVGVRLADGSMYKPIVENVLIDEPGITRRKVLVTRPATVSARFSEDGEDHRGANVSAYQNGKKVFSFRSFDEVLARPGPYEFRTEPNKDNKLRVEETLIEAEHTVIQFDLVNTVQLLIQYKLSNGETDQRSGQLLKDKEPIYTLSSKNYATVIPGTYELRDRHPRSQVLNPLPPGTMITVTNQEKQTIDVPMSAGYIVAKYGGAERDVVSKNQYIYVHALDENGKSIGSKTLSSGKTAVAKPGKYRLLGHSGKGYYDPVLVTVEHGKTVKATVVAKPTAHVSMSYAAGNYSRTPDRATLVPLDGQKPIKTYMGVGKVLKVPPGRYMVRPHSYTPEALPSPEFTLTAGETKAIVLQLK